MIIWLASYPKNGNTLVRSMLASYFFSSDGIYNFDLLKNIRQFPSAALFESLGVDIKKEKEVVKNYIKAQESFNKKDAVQFLKTHSYLFNINNDVFTDLNNSLGVIYIVRDPRNVVTSLANFISTSPMKAADHLIHTTEIGGDLNSDVLSERIKVYTSSWSGNFNSWKSFKSNEKYLLIKYEDLITDREATLKKVLKFIYKLKNINFEINNIKLKNVIETTDFEYMKNLENKKGFIEGKINKKTSAKIPFFNLGPKNDWKILLNLEIIKKIEKAFKKEMEELGYL